MISSRPLLPWAVAAACLSVALAALSVAWQAGAVGIRQAVPTRDEGSGKEVASLRRRLTASANEAAALRMELDRMRVLLALKKASDARDIATGEDQLSEQQRRKRLEGALARLDGLVSQLHGNPDQSVFVAMQDVLRAMLGAPQDGPGAFLEKYRTASDPLEKVLLLPHLAARLGSDLPGFVSNELEHAEDPALRAQLVAALRVHTQPAEDPVARELLFEALHDEKSPAARQHAVEALSTLRSPETEDALLQVAAADPDLAVREASIRTLAADPAARDRLLRTLATQGDRLRTLGECAIRLAGGETAPESGSR